MKKKTILALVVVGLMVCANGAFAQPIDFNRINVIVARDMAGPSDISFINIVGARFMDPTTAPAPLPKPVEDPNKLLSNTNFDNINFFADGGIKSDTDPFRPHPPFPKPPFIEDENTSMVLGGVEDMSKFISNRNFDSIIDSNVQNNFDKNGFTNALSMSKFNGQQNVMSNALINLNDSIQQVAFTRCDGINIFDKICIGSSK